MTQIDPMLAQDKDKVKIVETWTRLPDGQIINVVTYNGLSPDEYYKREGEVKPK